MSIPQQKDALYVEAELVLNSKLTERWLWLAATGACRIQLVGSSREASLPPERLREFE